VKEISMSSPDKPRSRTRLVLIAALVIVFAIPVAVMASHSFNDVPDSNTFHEDIAWLADNEVTLGCNPPDNTLFCPSDEVTRQQMAAFMRRFAGTMGNAGSQVTDFNSSLVVDSATWVELLSVNADAIDVADVSLAAHVYLERAATENQRYQLKVAATSCDGDPIGTGWWRPDNSDGGFEATTLAITGSTVIDGPTTFVLCAAKFSSGGPEVIAHMRGLTATWTPTSGD
jgi:hypothetical protein